MAIADKRPTAWMLVSLVLCACSHTPYTEQTLSASRAIQALGDMKPPISSVDESSTESLPRLKPDTSPLELNLNQTVEIALETDPQIRSGLETVHQSVADLLTSSLPPNPMVTISSTLMPLGKSFTPTRQGGPPQFDTGMSFPIDWFLFGKRVAAMAVARSGVDVANADFADLVRRRISAAIATFYDVLEAQATVELAREDLADLAELEHITATRVEIGGVGTIELDRIRLSIFSSRRELRARETALAASLSRLKAALGLADSRPLVIRGTLDVVNPIKPIAMESAQAVALENRQDIQSLRLKVEQTAAVVTNEERKTYPQIAPAIGYTRQFQEKAIGYPDASSFGVGVNLTVPLFDRNQGNITKARSQRTQSELDLKAGEVSLRSEVEQAVHAYESSYQTLSSDDPGQIEAARHVRDKIRAAYELGGKTLIEVMDAQRAYRETYRLHIAGRSDYWHSLHALNSALAKQVLR